MTKPQLLFTIDVEEDMPYWTITDPITVRNVQGLRRLADLCGDLGVRPTYLCTYPTVTIPESAHLLRELHAAGDCEIGTHLHAWNTPPFEGLPGRPDVDERRVPYYQFELGAALFRKKLDVLHGAIADLTGVAPVSFRSGRFGIDDATMGELVGAGYLVDSSVTPLEEHLEDNGPDFRSAPQLPYRPDAEDITRAGRMEIVEVPVSVALTRRWPRFFSQAFVRIPKATHLRGLLSRDYLRLVDFAWLYPARFDVELMSKAADALINMRSPVLNVFLHSSELTRGASGRIVTDADVEECFARIRGVLEYCLREHAAVPATLGEAGRALRPSLGLPPLAAPPATTTKAT